jgi:hypothetical protein
MSIYPATYRLKDTWVFLPGGRGFQMKCAH